jgi:hypothetical protein
MNAAETAEEIIDLIRTEIASLDKVGERILARRIFYYVKPLAAIPEEKPEPVKPMTEQEAAAFGKTFMEFGEFRGQPVDSVPVDRLEWYADASRGNYRQLHRYLNSPRVKRERDNDGE